MGKFDRQIATSKRLIKDNGQAVTWRQVVDGAASDPSQPWKPGATVPTDKTVYIVFLPESDRGYEYRTLMAGTEVPKGRLKGLMGAVDFNPSVKDYVIRDSEKLAIRSLNPLAPNGQIILYEIEFDV